MTTPQPPLTDFKLLSFDCYGTLIDWETGIYTSLSHLLQTLAQTHPDHPLTAPTAWLSLVEAFGKQEEPLCLSRPGKLYPALLSEAYVNLALSLDLPRPSDAEVEAFGKSTAEWPAFPDSVAALRKLKDVGGYKLVVLSNVDNDGIMGTLQGPLGDGSGDGKWGVDFDAVYTAEDIGSYKPSGENFEYLLRKVKAEFGVEKGEILHVGHGLKADHVPAKEFGMSSAWIKRRGGALEEVEGKVAFGWEFETMGDMAEAVEKEGESKGRGA